MWAGGDILMGDYILLVDADTRVPADCLLDGVSEMQQDGGVAIMQYSTEPFLVSLLCCCMTSSMPLWPGHLAAVQVSNEPGSLYLSSCTAQSCSWAPVEIRPSPPPVHTLL